MPDIGKPEVLILLLVILVLFGAKRLPGAARSLGQSMRIFKAETKGLRSDDEPASPAAAAAPPALPPTQVPGAPGAMPTAPLVNAPQDAQAPPTNP
jgi:sec-independent protein translocase protein TatA